MPQGQADKKPGQDNGLDTVTKNQDYDVKMGSQDSNQTATSSSRTFSSLNNQDLESMRYEQRRLDTFMDNWPANAPVEARKVAKAGLFRSASTSSASSTSVLCPWCGCVLDGWNFGDQVMARHRQASPDCPFILNSSDNVPLIGDQPSSSNSGNRSVNNSIVSNAGEEIVRELSTEVHPAPASSSDERDHHGSILEGEEDEEQGEDVGPSPRLQEQQQQDQQEQRPPPPRPRPSSSGPASAYSASDLKRESVRRRTFVGWSVPYISPADLARAGFIYTGSRDCVRCVFCGEYVGEWDPEDEPEREHRNLFPHCPLMRDDACGNVTLDDEEEMTSSLEGESVREAAERRWLERAAQLGRERRARHTVTATSISPPPAPSSSSSSSRLPSTDPMSEDEAGVRNRVIDSNSGPERGIRWTSVGGRDGPASRGGVIRHTGPAHPKYSTCEARLRSFRDWPPALRQRPQQLAEAGFFYMGLSDQVKCFSCDGGLRNWQSEDEPWTEHARWFSRCNFVRLVKGDEFVAKSLAERPPENNLPPFPEDEITPSNRPSDEEARLRQWMASPVAAEAMAQGLDASRIKVALRDRLRAGLPNFSSSRQLIDAVFGVHREQEDRVGVENESSPAAFARRRGSSTSTPSLVETNTSESGTGPQSMDFEVGRQESHHTSMEERPSLPNAKLARSNSHSVTVPSSSRSEPVTPSTSATEEQKSQSQIPHSITVGQEISATLEQENRRLREQRLCKVCMDNEVGVVFVPCGHLICCVQCAPALRDCPLCRQSIQGTVKTYMS